MHLLLILLMIDVLFYIFGRKCWLVQSIKLAVKMRSSLLRSSLAAEAIARLDGLEATLYISGLFKEAYKNYKIPREVYTDNKLLHDALQSSKFVTVKCLRIDIGALNEIIFNKEIQSITWIKSAQQITNSLKKHDANSLPLIKVLQKRHF